MARTRLIKPDFFLDPELGEVSINARYAFAGLWCQADKAGRLRNEPKKLKVVIFPYDDVNIDELLQELTKKPFIKIYSINDVSYIQIINWEKHQSPHHTEKESIIPLNNGDITVRARRAPFNIKHQYKVSRGGSRGEFVKPTLEEVTAYCKERGNKIDPQWFLDSNEAKGWVIGKNGNPAKDWKAMIRTWEKNGYESNVKEKRML